MRNHFRKPKNVNCANTIFLKQTILEAKIHERSEWIWSFNAVWMVKSRKVGSDSISDRFCTHLKKHNPITKHIQSKKRSTTHSFVEFWAKGKPIRGRGSTLQPMDAGPFPLPLNGFPSALPFLYSSYPRHSYTDHRVCFSTLAFDFQRGVLNIDIGNLIFVLLLFR